MSEGIWKTLAGASVAGTISTIGLGLVARSQGQDPNAFWVGAFVLGLLTLAAVGAGLMTAKDGGTLPPVQTSDQSGGIGPILGNNNTINVGRPLRPSPPAPAPVAEFSRLRIKEFCDGDTAFLRVENSGPPCEISFDMLEIDGIESSAIPYFLFWRLGRGVYNHVTSKKLPRADYWDVVVAELAKDRSHIWFPQPHGVGLRREINSVDSWVCVRLECNAIPPLEKTEYTYMISFHSDAGFSIIEITREGFDDLSQPIVRERIRELMAEGASEDPRAETPPA